MTCILGTAGLRINRVATKSLVGCAKQSRAADYASGVSMKAGSASARAEYAASAG